MYILLDTVFNLENFCDWLYVPLVLSERNIMKGCKVIMVSQKSHIMKSAILAEVKKTELKT
jgi:hypothetical protein